MEIFPETTNKPRKRVRHQSEQERNKKQKRAKSESHVSSRKKPAIPAVRLKPPCHNKCHVKVSEDEHKDIFNSYYALADYSRQRDFIHSSTNNFTKESSTADRIVNAKFFFFFQVKETELKYAK